MSWAWRKFQFHIIVIITNSCCLMCMYGLCVDLHVLCTGVEDRGTTWRGWFYSSSFTCFGRSNLGCQACVARASPTGPSCPLSELGLETWCRPSWPSSRPSILSLLSAGIKVSLDTMHPPNGSIIKRFFFMSLWRWLRFQKQWALDNMWNEQQSSVQTL